MNRISKPMIVDLLRIADREHWFYPRIRYASIRSKPALLDDLRKYFSVCIQAGDEWVDFLPKRGAFHKVPMIRYHLKRRKFYFDNVEIDAPKISREKPLFVIRKETVVVCFP